MVQIKNVAVFGGAGVLGTPLVKAIVDSGKFNVTVVTRPSSTSTFQPSVKVVKADYTSVDALTAALKGQDAVVSAVGFYGLQVQSVFIDAAIAAGVKRFIPSEFGSDLANPKLAALPFFGYKVATRKHIEAKVAAGADITYSYVLTGAFLEWGLETSFILDWAKGTPTLYNGGDALFSATNLPTIGQAVVGVLSNYEETKNRDVYIEDIAISQSQLLALAKKVAPEKKFEPIIVNLDDVKKSADEGMAKGDFSVIIQYLYVAIFDKAYESKFKKLDNELLGIKGLTEKDVEAIWKRLLV